MKTPKTLPLPPLQHHHTALRIRHALDGRGTLHGFFDFVEEAGRRLRDRAPSGRKDGADSEREGPLTSLVHAPVQSLFEVRDQYLPRWHEARQAIPWYDNDPAAAHVLALHLLLDVRAPWQPVRPRKPLYGRYKPSRADRAEWELPPQLSDQRAWPSLRDALTAYARHSDEADSTPRQVARISFRPRSVEATWHDDEPETISLSLTPELHEPFRQAFGNEFYNRAENALLTALDDPAYAVSIKKECAVLEGHGVPRIALSEVLSLIEDEMDDTEQVISGDPTWVEQAHEHFDRPLDGNREEWLDLLVEHLEYEPDFVWADHSFWQGMQEAYSERGSYAAVDFVYLARELGLIRNGRDLKDLDDLDFGSLLQRHYGLLSTAPEREIALKILARKGLPEDIEGDAPTAVDFHLIELFRLYIDQVAGPASSLWRHRAIWTTLSRLDLFEHQAVLEAWSASRATREPNGIWNLERGRKTAASFTHEQVERICKILNRLAPISSTPSETQRQPTPLTALPPGLRQSGKVRIPTSPALVDTLLLYITDEESEEEVLFNVLDQLIEPDDTEALRQYVRDWVDFTILRQLDHNELAI